MYPLLMHIFEIVILMYIKHWLFTPSTSASMAQIDYKENRTCINNSYFFMLNAKYWLQKKKTLNKPMNILLQYMYIYNVHVLEFDIHACTSLGSRMCTGFTWKMIASKSFIFYFKSKCIIYLMFISLIVCICVFDRDFVENYIFNLHKGDMICVLYALFKLRHKYHYNQH